MRILSTIKVLLLAASFPLLFGACETIVDPNGLPYVERIIVRGVFTTGQSVDSINISRTLPINEEYSEEKAAVNDAVVTVQTGGKSYPLQSIGHGFYGNRELVAQAGEEYKLVVEWHGKSVTATTIAPYPVSIDSGQIIAKSNSSIGDSLLEVQFVPRGNQVYALTMKRIYDEIRYGDSVPVHVSYEEGIWQSDRIARGSDADVDGSIRLDADYSFRVFEGSGSISSDTLVALLYTFDPAFYDYYQTYHNDNNGDGPFSSGGETVAWNVDGDGIGMFIGRALTERRVRP